MNFTLVLPLLVSVALTQSVLLARVDVWGARPDLMLLMVVGWSVLRSSPGHGGGYGADEGLLWGVIGGLMVDLMSGGPLGGTAMALLAAAWLAGQPLGQGLGSPTVWLVLMTFIATLLHHLVLLLVLAYSGHAVNWADAILRIAGPSALLNAALSPFVYRALAWLERRTRRERLTT